MNGIIIYRTDRGILGEKDGQHYDLGKIDWDSLVNRPDLHSRLSDLIEARPKTNPPSEIYAPVVSQEIWAAGVTYLRSRDARMAESETAATVYDLVYEAERPELFFKSTAARALGPDQELYLRRDSFWDVPEPELTLVINREGTIVGYTIGNDLSSRSIEGENPLYLPQAKVWDHSAAVGPGVLVLDGPIPRETSISMRIVREGKTVFMDQVLISQMKRTHEELVGFLFREMSFPEGVLLMTGTSLVPDESFTLQPGDQVAISIDGIGTLVNPVGRRPDGLGTSSQDQ